MTPEFLNALKYLIDMSNVHIDDVDSGIEDGDYKLSENPDLEEKRAAVRLIESYVESGAATELPTAIVDINNGAIVTMMSNVPMKVIFLDEDVEGGEADNVMNVSGEDVYVTVKETSPKNKDSESVSPGLVAEILKQVNQGFAAAGDALQ